MQAEKVLNVKPQLTCFRKSSGKKSVCTLMVQTL